MNILNPIWEWVIDDPDRIAVRSQQANLTFARLGEAILQYAEYFTQSGIIEGEIVALQVDSELPHLLCSLALAFLGTGQYTVSSGTASHNARAGNLLGIKRSIVMSADSPSIAEIRIPLNRMPNTLPPGRFAPCRMQDPAIFRGSHARHPELPGFRKYSRLAMNRETCGEIHTLPQSILAKTIAFCR